MNDLSIHPRNWTDVPGFGKGTNNTKRNTAEPQQGNARKHDRKAAWLNARRNYHAQDKGKPGSHKMPGSMNDGK